MHFHLRKHGAWKSKKQKVVSCSSAEAEYRAMLKLTNELVCIKGILRHLEIEQATPTTMHCNNQAAIHIATNSVFHERTKHIEVDRHKVRQMIVLRPPSASYSSKLLSSLQ